MASPARLQAQSRSAGEVLNPAEPREPAESRRTNPAEPRGTQEKAVEPDFLADVGPEREHDRPGDGVHSQMVDEADVMADAMEIGERAQVDMNSIAVDVNPGRHRDQPEDISGEHHEPGGFQSEDENRRFWKFSLTFDGNVELQER